MELKGSNNWSDVDDESDVPRTSKEAPKPSVPERRVLFDLGVIYNRRAEAEPALARAVFQERDRSAPEVAQGIVLGEEAQGGGTGPNAAEQAALQQRAAEAVGDNDDDEESEKPQSSSQATNKSAPRPVMPVAKAAVPAPVYGPKILQSTPQTAEAYPGFDQAAAESQASFPVPEQQPGSPPFLPTEMRAMPLPQPAEYFPPAGGGGNILPPPPPEHPTPSYPEPERWSGEPNPVLATSSPNTYRSTPNQVEYVTRRSFENAQDSLKHKAAPLIMVAALTWYLARRPIKPLQERVGQLQEVTEQQHDQLTRLRYEQQTAEVRIAEQNRQIEQFTKAHIPFRSEQQRAPAAEQQRVVGENGEEIVLQPGQRLERAGSYSVVVDEHNRVVGNAIRYGEEYQRDLQRERPPTPFGAQDARFVQGGLGGAGGSGQPVSGSTGHMLPGVQMPTDHRLPMNSAGQTPDEEAQHLLTGPKLNPVLASITSPWLWLGVGILLIAFFAAATI